MSNPISELLTSGTFNLLRLIKHSVKDATLFLAHRKIQSIIGGSNIVFIITNGELLRQDSGDEKEDQNEN